MTCCAILSVLSLSGCTLPRSTRPVVKIGLIAPFEGLGRPLGYEVLYAVKLAVQECNAAGGVAGYRVALVALNDDDDAGQAARQARKLDVDDDVLGVIGPLSRTTARAVAEPLAAAGLAWIVPASAPDEVIVSYPNAFRLFAGDADLAEAAIGRALAAGGAQQVAVSPAGDFAPSLQGAAERLGAYRPLSSRDSPGDGSVALGGNAEQVADEVLNLPDDAVVVAGPEAGRAVVAQRAGTAAEGLIWVSSAPPADAEALSPTFVSGYQTLAGSPPGPYAVLAYDATHVLLDAIELDVKKHGRPTRPGVAASLSAVQVRGLSGDVRFDEQGTWSQAPIFAYRVAGDDIFARP